MFVADGLEPEGRPDVAGMAEAFRPAVRGDVPAPVERVDTPVPAWGEPQPPADSGRRRDTYREDIPIAIVSAILAVATFFPWYKGQGVDAEISAWSSGTWGPIIFFLGIGSLAFVVLRRLGVRLSLPFEEALLLEVAGWIALAGGVFKSRFRPAAEGVLSYSWGLWVGLGAAFLLAFLAGRMAPHAPLVRRPRWMREKGGIAAAAILVAIVTGSAVFGTINKAQPLGSAPIETPDVPGVIRGRLPTCAEGFPVPSIMRPVQGLEQPCQAHLQSERPLTEVVNALRTSLQQARWTATVGQTGGATTLNITAPKCATAAVVGAEQGSVAVVAFGICTSATPSPGPS